MKLVVGLGNPEEKHQDNRHNVGFVMADHLQSTVYGGNNWEKTTKFKAVVCHPKAVDLLIVKPQTFMNASGEAVVALASFYKIPADNIFVIHDDLDIRLGEYKIQKGIGPKLHNGVASIEEKLDTKDFWRVRIGIENRKPILNYKLQMLNEKQTKILGIDYVLQDFTNEEKRILGQVIEKVTKELVNILRK